MIKIKISAGTNVGLVRNNNEDNFVVSPDLSQSQWTIPNPEFIELGKYGALLVVADGMGGTNAGEVASAIAVETIQKEFAPGNLIDIIDITDDAKRIEAIKQFMFKVVKVANHNIVKRSQDDSTTQGMGTTVVMVWVLDAMAYICWCGDSRCYVCNASSGICRLSKDHSYVQELVDSGHLDAENAFDHPNSNIITRCLGEEGATSNPDFRIYPLHNNDILLLCTDGLCGLCRDEETMAVMTNENNAEISVCKDELISSALAAGGYDNVTVVLCQIEMNGLQVEDISADHENKEEKASISLLSNTINQRPGKHRGMRWFFFLVLLVLFVAIFFCKDAIFSTDEMSNRAIDSTELVDNNSLSYNN